ncbi:MAG TPA: DUF1990 family protein [Candidatus Acidoferrum sp.]|nr:DUF1990 family protein [Candidatus Acidoferrum sp.]
MGESERRQILSSAAGAPGASPQYLTLAEGGIETLPAGFVRDRLCSQIGRGVRAFAAAREAFLQWRQSDLRWVAVVDSAHTAGVWTLNVCRIQDAIDTATRFEFVYATTTTDVEDGQERVLIDFDPDTQVVSDSVEAVSRPRHPLVWLAYPFARAMQHRFVRDSLERMRDILNARA